MERHLISIIIVNWNGLEYLKTCFESLSKVKTKHLVEIVIVDNASIDGSLQWLHEKSFSWPIKIIKNKENVGFAEGNNRGVAAAKGDLILFLNNDTLVEANFIDTLVNCIMTKENCAAVQPKIMQLPRKNYVDSVGSYFTSTGFLYHFGHNKSDQKKYNKESEIFSMKGACMLFRKSALNEIGVFDKNFFAYFEESDLCMRALIAGYSLWYEPKAIIYHKGGGTSQHIQTGFVLMHSYKNRLQTYLKNFQALTLLKVVPMHILLMLFVSVVYACMFKFVQSLAILKALWWNATHISYIRKQRKKIAKLRKVQDNIFLPKLTKKVRPSYFYHLVVTSLAGYTD